MTNLERNFHHEKPSSNIEVNRCWSPQRRNAYAGAHNKHTDFHDTCVKWGRNLREPPENWGGHALCQCHKLGVKDVDEHHCLICSIAARLQNAETPDDIVDILSDECDEFPGKSLSKIQPFPVVEKKTVKKVQQLRESRHLKLKDRVEVKEESLEEETETELDKTVSGESITAEETSTLNDDTDLEPGAGMAPMPSGHFVDSDELQKYREKKREVKMNQPLTRVYPYCGTSMDSVCRCVGGDKRTDRFPIITRNLAEQTKLSEESVEEDLTESDSFKSVGCPREKIISPPNIYPTTALRTRLEAERAMRVKFSSKTAAEIPHTAADFQTHTKDYEFPVIEKTEEELQEMYNKADDTGFWARYNSETSVFSRPPVTTVPPYCNVCNGLVIPSDVDEPVFNYLVGREKTERQQGDFYSIQCWNSDENIPVLNIIPFVLRQPN